MASAVLLNHQLAKHDAGAVLLNLQVARRKQSQQVWRPLTGMKQTVAAQDTQLAQSAVAGVTECRHPVQAVTHIQSL